MMEAILSQAEGLWAWMCHYSRLAYARWLRRDLRAYREELRALPDTVAEQRMRARDAFEDRIRHIDEEAAIANAQLPIFIDRLERQITALERQ